MTTGNGPLQDGSLRFPVWRGPAPYERWKSCPLPVWPSSTSATWLAGARRSGNSSVGALVVVRVVAGAPAGQLPRPQADPVSGIDNTPTIIASPTNWLDPRRLPRPWSRTTTTRHSHMIKVDKSGPIMEATSVEHGEYSTDLNCWHPQGRDWCPRSVQSQRIWGLAFPWFD